MVPFVDVGTAGGLHYLVWPLVDGTTLEALVQQNGRLEPKMAALYALQIAQGLNVSHENNLFHGLVKPSNIMIGADNQARILDFGIGSLLVENEGESLVDTMSTANTLTSGLDCASPEGRLMCDYIVRPEAMDAEIDRLVNHITGAGMVSAAGNRRALRIGEEPLDEFRRYFSVYAREQAQCHFSPALISNLERNWDAKNRRG